MLVLRKRCPSELTPPPDERIVEKSTLFEVGQEARHWLVFGERVVSEKPLDEVVLEHLVENARKRKRKNR